MKKDLTGLAIESQAGQTYSVVCQILLKLGLAYKKTVRTKVQRWETIVREEPPLQSDQLLPDGFCHGFTLGFDVKFFVDVFDV